MKPNIKGAQVLFTVRRYVVASVKRIRYTVYVHFIWKM